MVISDRTRRIAVFAILAALLAACTYLSVQLWQSDAKGQDIYYLWSDGQRLVQGENPYARVLTGNMRDNDKYPTYFPLFIEAGALVQWAGLAAFEPWIDFWRVVFLFFNLGIGLLVFSALYSRRLWLAALFGSAFWLLNRWTLHVVQVAHLDFVALFLLLLAVILFPRRPTAALLIFGASLAVKQIGIFAAPLFLIWTWQASPKGQTVRRTLRGGLLMAAIPFVASLPFLFWNGEALVRSVLFSATRLPLDHFGAPSADGHLGWVGLPAKAPMLLMLAAVYLLAWRRQLGPYFAVLLALAVFTDFNSVLFRQYLVWLVPFIPLILCDFSDRGLLKPQTQNALPA